MCSFRVDRSTLHWRPLAFALAVRLQNSQVKLDQWFLELNDEIRSFFSRKTDWRKSNPLNRYLGESENQRSQKQTIFLSASQGENFTNIAIIEKLPLVALCASISEHTSTLETWGGLYGFPANDKQFHRK